MCAGTNLFFDAMWVIERKYLLFSGTYNSKSSPRYHIYDRTPPSSLPCSACGRTYSNRPPRRLFPHPGASRYSARYH